MARTKQTMAYKYQFLIVGLGLTGLSVARFLHRRGIPFAITDSSEYPSHFDALLDIAPRTPVFRGPLKALHLFEAAEVVLSPGVPLSAVTAQSGEVGQRCISDIELFARHAPRRSLAAITGTNGKSTTAALLTDAAKCAALNVGSGGNLSGEYPGSMPALDLLDHPADFALYVLELSSFQLEHTYTLKPSVSVILNLQADHLDRHPSFAAYRAAKLRIHRNSAYVITNRDAQLALEIPGSAAHTSFGSSAPQARHFGIVGCRGDRHIVYGDKPWLAESELAVKGDTALLNIQAMFAMGRALGLPYGAMYRAAKDFRGLPHRLVPIGCLAGANWYDDSKATNVAAACAAVHAMDGRVVFIGGGESKGADFAPLATLLESKARALVLLGKDAAQIAAAVSPTVRRTIVDTMEQAVLCARDYARPGDSVLLSPACSSHDRYPNYRARGAAFVAAYQKYAAGEAP